MIFRSYFQCIVCIALFVLGETSYARSCEEVVTGTSLISEMVQQMTGSQESLYNLLPPNMCPGHYDMRPGDLEAVAACRLLVLQPWQRAMPSIENVVKASKVPEARIRVIAVPGNWMLPATRIKAVRTLSEVLAVEYPERKEAIRAAVKIMVADSVQVDAWGSAQLKALSPETIKVLCSEQQGDLARWAGLTVVQTYGRPESLSVAQVAALTDRTKENRIALVIDNLQSGDTKMGESLARDTGAVHVVLSNFPGAEKGQDTWEQTFKKNVERIVTAIRQWQSAAHE